jgi:arsenate reductase
LLSEPTLRRPTGLRRPRPLPIPRLHWPAPLLIPSPESAPSILQALSWPRSLAPPRPRRCFGGLCHCFKRMHQMRWSIHNRKGRVGVKKRVLILCTGNSARSQMAEGLLRHDAGDRFEVFSAGTRPSQVRPEAIAVMRELGIDISSHRSKSVDDFADKSFDYVLTVCDSARESCPIFPGDAVVISPELRRSRRDAGWRRGAARPVSPRA